MTYQDRIVACPHIQIDGSDTNCDNKVNHKPKPVIPEVSRHVNERTFGQYTGLHQETSLTSSRV